MAWGRISSALICQSVHFLQRRPAIAVLAPTFPMGSYSEECYLSKFPERSMGQHQPGATMETDMRNQAGTDTLKLRRHRQLSPPGSLSTPHRSAAHQMPDGGRVSFDVPKNSRKEKKMKGRALVAGGLLSVALLSLTINGIPQATAMENAPMPAASVATCAVSDQVASTEVSLNETARTSAPASLGNLSISAVSTLSELNMTNSVLPMHTKWDCDRAYERDSRKCRRAPGGARGRAICWGAIAAKYAACLAGANG